MKIPHIHIRDAALAYSGETVFSGINLDLPAGQWLGLLGPSGIGKSSFLRLIAGLHLPQEQSSGTIAADNHLPVFQQVAYMAQTDLLLPWLTVLDNATLGSRLRPHSHDHTLTLRNNALLLLDKAGLGSAANLYPHQLSGGMRQRVALVRTLMEDKPVVLMDEPFSALDAITRYKLQNLAADMLQHKTVLFITHDPAEALRLANRIYIMQGRPATLKMVEAPESRAPRPISDPEILNLQAQLYHELSIAAGDAA